MPCAVVFVLVWGAAHNVLQYLVSKPSFVHWMKDSGLCEGQWAHYARTARDSRCQEQS